MYDNKAQFDKGIQYNLKADETYMNVENSRLKPI